MPNNRYERREPSHNWGDIRPLLKDSAQITYEIIRPISRPLIHSVPFAPCYLR
jgi:hypothetical protein